MEKTIKTGDILVFTGDELLPVQSRMEVLGVCDKVIFTREFDYFENSDTKYYFPVNFYEVEDLTTKGWKLLTNETTSQ